MVETLVFRGPRIEQVRKIAPSTISILESKIDQYHPITREELMNAVEIIKQELNKTNIYSTKIEDDLASLGAIQYAARIGERIVTEQEIRTEIKEFTRTKTDAAEKLARILLEINPSDWNFPTEDIPQNLIDRYRNTNPNIYIGFSTASSIELAINTLGYARTNFLDPGPLQEKAMYEVEGEVYSLVAKTLHERGRENLARMKFEDAIAKNPFNPYLYWSYANHVLNQERVTNGDNKTALEYIERAIFLDPSNKKFKRTKEEHEVTHRAIRIPRYVDSKETYERIIKRE